MISPSTIAALSQLLDAHAAALAGRDPFRLEQLNAELAEALAAMRRPSSAGATTVLSGPSGRRELERVRARLLAHGALAARSAGANQRALAALGLDAAALPAAAADSSRSDPPARRATHLIA